MSEEVATPQVWAEGQAALGLRSFGHDDEVIRLTFQYTPEDFRRAYMLHYHIKVGLTRLEGLLLLLSGVIAIAAFLYNPWFGAISTIIIAYLIYGRWLLLVHYPQKTVADQERAGETLTLFDSNGMYGENREQQSALKWSAFDRVVADEHVFLLFMTQDRFVVLPRRVFTDGEAARFEAFLEANGLTPNQQQGVTNV